jgi:hypothetical protein
MEKTWKPKVGGILSIICGVAKIVLGIVFLIVAIDRQVVDLSYFEDDPLLPIVMIMYVIFMVIAGIVAGIGGIYALRRKLWGMALAGAILSSISYTGLLGIPALVFIALSRKEFKNNTSLNTDKMVE